VLVFKDDELPLERFSWKACGRVAGQRPVLGQAYSYPLISRSFGEIVS
jgi:hypothetical protein